MNLMIQALNAMGPRHPHPPPWSTSAVNRPAFDRSFVYMAACAAASGLILFVLAILMRGRRRRPREGRRQEVEAAWR